MIDKMSLQDQSVVGVAQAAHQPVQWHAKVVCEKFKGDWKGLPYELWDEVPEVIEREGNLLMYGGASCLWQCLIGNGTGTGGQTLTYFDNANAHIGVGDSNTAAAATQTDLQAATNKDRQPMEATYPQHTDAVTSGAASIIFRAVWGVGEGDFAWEEWGLFNASTGQRMLNRKVESLGTKSGGTWTLTITLTLA